MASGDIIYAWQEFDADVWSIIGVLAEGGQPIPLVHRDRPTVDAWRPIAKLHLNDTGHPIRLAAFKLALVHEADSR